MFLLINSAPKTAPIIAPSTMKTSPHGSSGKDSRSAALIIISAPNPDPSIAPIISIDTIFHSSLSYPANAASAASMRFWRPFTLGSPANGSL